MKDVIYKSSDNSLEIRLQFVSARRLKYTHLGKTYPIHTQCLLFSNGVLECFETIVKHQKDEHDPKFAFRKVAEMCMQSIDNKWLRSQVRIELNKALENYEQ